MTEKELHKLFADKLKGDSFPFNEKAWDSMEQMLDPQEPLSEMEYSKLFKDKLSAASFAYNPANWDEMELKLNEAQGAMSQEEMQKLFQTKFASQNFAYNPANWQRMEAILDGSAKRPLLYFWRSVAAIFLFAASVLGFQYFQPTVSTSPDIESISASPEENLPAIPKPQANNPVNKSSDSGLSATEKAPAIANTTAIITPAAAPPNSTSIAPSHLAAQASPQLSPNSALPFKGEAQQDPILLAKNSGLDRRNWRDLTIDLANSRLADLPTKNPLALAATRVKAAYVPKSYSKISLQGGPSVNPAYNGTTGTGFFAGLEYEYGFNDRISLSAGLVYNYSGDMGIESISDSTFFGLARTDVETHSHYKNMSAIRLPISFNVKINPKHSFSLGAYADAIIAVTMDEEKTTTIFKQDPKVEKMSGVAPESSFANYSAGAQVAYTYQYSKRFSVGLSQQYGFVDLTNDNQQNFSKHHQTSQTNLVLKYSIWQ